MAEARGRSRLLIAATVASRISLALSSVTLV
jgi:hypothetical protein